MFAQVKQEPEYNEASVFYSSILYGSFKQILGQHEADTLCGDSHANWKGGR